ncbi:MAG: DUF1801 domain-containing protein [Flavobacteriaceae bacterium]|nr:DUF1801 domain-containing protein [Flavobacteriaceae bacterium]
MNPIDKYLLNQKEPYQSIMLYVRSVILRTLPKIEEKYNYKIPFYHHNKNPLCYLNILKGTNYVDIAFVQGVFLQDQFQQLKNHNNRKQVRSMQVKSLEEFDEHMFVALLKEAAILLDNSKKAWNP